MTTPDISDEQLAELIRLSNADIESLAATMADEHSQPKLYARMVAGSDLDDAIAPLIPAILSELNRRREAERNARMAMYDPAAYPKEQP